MSVVKAAHDTSSAPQADGVLIRAATLGRTSARGRLFFPCWGVRHDGLAAYYIEPCSGARHKHALLFFPSHSLQQHSHAHMDTAFSDAAPRGHRSRVGVVGGPSCYRDYLCPRWIHNMQQAEMYGVYMAHKYAVGRRLPCIAVGIDNNAVLLQTVYLKAGTCCPVQLHLLRRIFWLRAWSGLQVAAF